MAHLLGLRVYLLGLIIVAVVPVLVFAGVILWAAGSDQLRQREVGLVRSAQLIAASVDRELFSMLALLEGLAQAPSLQEGDLAEFYVHLSQVGRLRETVISMQREDGTQLLNTRVPFGAELPAGGNLSARARVFETNAAAISDLFVGTVSRRATVAVAVPATARGSRVMLDMPIEPAFLSAMVGALVIDGSDVATLLDGEGRVVARSADHAAMVGRSAPAWQREAQAGRSDGLLRGRGEDGTQLVIGFARPQQAPTWVVQVARPAALVDGAWYQPLARLATAGGVVLLGALALAALLAHAILRPVRALTARAQALTAGELRQVAAHTDIREFHNLARATEAAEEAQQRRARADRTRAIEAAREDANAIFRAFAEATPDVVWIVDLATGRLSCLGPAYEGVWGETRDAVMRDLGHWRESVHADDRQAFAENLAAIAAGRTVDVEYRIRRPDGSLRWIRDLGFPLRDADGTISRAAGIARDVSARKDIETQLRTSDTRCTGLIEALGTLAWWSDHEGRMLEQRGHPVDRGILQRLPGEADWRALVHPADRARLDAAWAEGRATDSAWQATFRMQWPGEAPHWHLCRVAPIRAADGSVVEWAGVLLDMEQPPQVTDAGTTCEPA